MKDEQKIEEETYLGQIETYFGQMRKEQMKKLIVVGFTEEQALVLLDIIQTKAFSGGLL